MVKMYDFGVECSNISSNERKALAWPVAVWSCYIPDSETQRINILEVLLLQLVQKGFCNPEDILCNSVGFNKELINAALESCKNQGFFDRRHTNGLFLSEDGKAVVEKIENPYKTDLEVSKNSKKIYMVQDLITKSVIPVFDIGQLPDFYVEEEDPLQVRYQDYTGKKPKSASIKTALRYWSRLCSNRRAGIEYGINTIDLSLNPEENEEVDGFIPFEDEVEWQSFNEDEGVIEEPAIEKESETGDLKCDRELQKITILDDTPEIYYARGYIAIDRNAPDEIVIVSPFGPRLDDWFRTVVNRLRACDVKFEEEIQFFLEMKREELQEYIAFGNQLNISLFDEYPRICNNKEYFSVKKQIERLTRCKDRIQEGEDDSISFAQILRSAYEAILILVVKKNKYLLAYKKNTYESYLYSLRCLVNSYPFLTEEVYNEYNGDKLYGNIKYVDKDKGGYPTAILALIMMDAWKNKNGKSMDLLINLPNLPIRIKILTSSLKKSDARGYKGQGAAASHGGEEGARIFLSAETVLEQYREFETIFRAIYNRFIEGK